MCEYQLSNRIKAGAMNRIATDTNFDRMVASSVRILLGMALLLGQLSLW
jgi:hypothetical protein